MQQAQHDKLSFRHRADGESLTQYVRFVEEWLGRQSVEDLQEFCRHFKVGVEDLTIMAAARRLGWESRRVVSALEEEAAVDIDEGELF